MIRLHPSCDLIIHSISIDLLAIWALIRSTHIGALRALDFLSLGSSEPPVGLFLIHCLSQGYIPDGVLRATRYQGGKALKIWPSFKA